MKPILNWWVFKGLSKCRSLKIKLFSKDIFHMFISSMTKAELAAFIKTTISESLKEEIQGFQLPDLTNRNYLTITKVAERFKVTKATIHNWAKKGSIKKYKINGRTLLKLEEIEMIINKQIY